MTRIKLYGGPLNGQHRDLLDGGQLPDLGRGARYVLATHDGVQFALPDNWSYRVVKQVRRHPEDRSDRKVSKEMLTVMIDRELDEVAKAEGWIEVDGTRNTSLHYREAEPAVNKIGQPADNKIGEPAFKAGALFVMPPPPSE